MSRSHAPVRLRILLSAAALLVWLASIAAQLPAATAQEMFQQPTLPPRPTLEPTLPPRPTLPPPTLPSRPTLAPTGASDRHEEPPTPQATPMILPVSGDPSAADVTPLLAIGFGVLVISACLAVRQAAS